MRRKISIIVITMVILAFASIALAQAKTEPAKPVAPAAEVKKPLPVKKVTGSVVFIDKARITIMTAAGPMTILADEKATVITHQGAPFALKDLTSKSKIVAEYELDATKPLQTAKSIDVKTLAPKEEKK